MPGYPGFYVIHPPEMIIKFTDKSIILLEYDGFGCINSGLNFYDFDNEPLVSIDFEIANPSKEDIQILRNYINNNPDFLNDYIVGMEINGDIVFYKRLSNETNKMFINFINLIKTKKIIMPFWKRGFKAINKKIDRFKDNNYQPLIIDDK